MEQAFVIVTRNGLAKEVDTITSGPDAAKQAQAHKAMLQEEFDYAAGEVLVYGVEGAGAGSVAELVADRIRSGGPFGRKAFARLREEHGAKVGFARFHVTVTATIG